MKRKFIWKIILCASIVFIVLQASMWLGVTNTGTNISESDQTVLKRFLAASEKQALSVFLIDIAVLGRILSTHSERTAPCYILCEPLSNNITFGLEGDEQNPQLFNFTVSYFSQCIYRTLPTDADEKKDLPVFCWLQSKHLTIHLVIFYNITEDLWWHGSLEGRNKWFGHAEGIFPRISTQKLNLTGLQFRIPQNPLQFLDDRRRSKFIPCNKTRARQFFSHFGKDETEEAEIFQAKAIAFIRQAKDILDDLNVPFWLSSGTCLGWFRQCDIIPYSKDVDLGIFIKDYEPAFVPAMLNAGMQLKRKFGQIKDSFELTFQASGIRLDIFFFYEEESYIWNGGTQASTGNKYKYVFPKFTLCWTLFFSMVVRIPCETESYIEANYGLNWFTPVRDWDWKRSPPNVKPNGVWAKEERDRVVNVYI